MSTRKAKTTATPKPRPAGADMTPADVRQLIEAGGTFTPKQAPYTFPDGTAVQVMGIPPLVLMSLQSDIGRPLPPVRVVQMAGGAKMEVPRKDNEPVLMPAQLEQIKDETKRAEEQAYYEYRLALAQWENDARVRQMRTLFLMSVVDGPPPTDTALWQAIGFGDPFEIKFNWLSSKLPTETAMAHFIEFITSLTMPTEEGIAAAEDMFPGALPAGDQSLAKRDAVDAEAVEEAAEEPAGD